MTRFYPWDEEPTPMRLWCACAQEYHRQEHGLFPVVDGEIAMLTAEVHCIRCGWELEDLREESPTPEFARVARGLEEGRK